MSERTTRRTFGKRVSRTGAGLALGAAASDLGRSRAARGAERGANEKIVMGVIGCGNMGQRNITRFLRQPQVEFGGLCDVDREHAEQAAEMIEKSRGSRPPIVKDFRKLLEIKGIDAVLIATPDHWHALPFIAACEASKDIYQEKPLGHNIVEGRAMVNAAKRFDRVVQCGTWQRSTPQFIRALDFVHSGKLGKIHVCRAWATKNGGAIGREQPTKVPAHLDWDFWLGPARFVPYTPNRSHQSFRWFFNTASGQAGDSGVHMLDIVMEGMKHPDPVSVDAVGGNFVLDDDRDTPDTMCVTFQFKEFVATWEHRFGNARPPDSGRSGLAAEFIGTNGSLIVHRGVEIQVYPEGGRMKDRPEEGPPIKNPSSVGRDVHIGDFLACIKTRKTPRSDVASVHRSTILCHLANLSYLVKRRIHWDPVKEEPVGDAEAKGCLVYQREYRKPWKLPMYPA